MLFLRAPFWVSLFVYFGCTDTGVVVKIIKILWKLGCYMPTIWLTVVGRLKQSECSSGVHRGAFGGVHIGFCINMRQNLMSIANHIVCIGCYDYIKGTEIHQCEMCTVDFKEVGWSRMSLSFRSDWPIWTSARQLLLAQIKFKWPRLKLRNTKWTEINTSIQ